MTTPVATDPVTRGIDEMIAHGLYALRVQGDTFEAVGIRDGDIAVVRRQFHVDVDGERFVVTDGPRTAVWYLYHLGDGLVEARDSEGRPQRVASEAAFGIQGRVLTVIQRV